MMRDFSGACMVKNRVTVLKDGLGKLFGKNIRKGN
jgi:hypothetical protein